MRDGAWTSEETSTENTSSYFLCFQSLTARRGVRIRAPSPFVGESARRHRAPDESFARLRSTCAPLVRMLRALTMLCLGLTSVGGWQMTALPVPSGHAQCASSQASARQAVAPRMCSFDHLSSEFQARRRHPAPCRSSQSYHHLSLPSGRRRGWRTSARARSLASLARCCSSTRQRARGCCSSTLASGTRACTLCRAVRRPGRPTARTCSRSRSRRRRLASRCCCRCAVLPLAALFTSVRGSHPRPTHA